MPFVAHRVFGWGPARIDAGWGLRDLEPGMAYAVCNSLICRECGMLFLDMRFDDDEMASLYDDYRGEAYTAARESFEPGYRARNALLLDGSKYIAAVEAFLAPHLSTSTPRILDWGGDTGVNTPFARSAECHHVYDISSRPLVESARAVSRDEFQGARYDLIVFSNVLEHVPTPRTTLAEIAAAMHPGALLYLEVPQEEIVRSVPDPDERLRRKKHWHEHINFFTRAALDAAFAQAGLHILECRTHEIEAAGRKSHVFSIAARLRERG
jgi:SAM-dependent methyltransferase